MAAMAYKEHLSHADITRGIHPFVTISREAGAGGHRLAETLLKQMQAHERIPLFRGWQMMDQALCRGILENPKLKVSLDAVLTEDLHSEVEDIVNSLLGGFTPQAQVMIEVFKTIRTLATFGKVIIVGHGGVCLTRELPNGIHVRLVAALPNRVRRISELFHLSEREAQEMVEKSDRSRARLLKTHFSKDIDDPLLYDVTWNTDSVSMEEISSYIVDLIESRVTEFVASGSHA